jgi:hypothetical protein
LVVGKHRFALWFILLITATPFHLLYVGCDYCSKP